MYGKLLSLANGRGMGKVVHIGFDDPPKLTENIQNEDEILDVYRRVRDEIKDVVSKIELYMEKN